ncbi:MAG: hypothetical protein HFI70_07580 [Lachnospiraceae bacterium]|nr:hypothetical protein [Lachnospiraceae bacterium]
MYSTVIEIKKNVTGETLQRLCQMAENAFTNRAGSVKNSSKDPHRLIFKGGRTGLWLFRLGGCRVGG